MLTAEGPPFQLPDGELKPLERRAIAKLDAETVEIRDVAVNLAGDPTVVNDPLGGFALWGFPTAEPKLLGSGS